MEEIQSKDGYMGRRFICKKCHSEVSLLDLYCWICGKKLQQPTNTQSKG